MPARRTPRDLRTTRRVATERDTNRTTYEVRHVEARNGVPRGQPYKYRAPRPRFALEAIARAERQHGTPDPGKPRYRPPSSPETQAVLDAVLAAPDGVRAADLTHLARHPGDRLRKLAKSGRIASLGDGRYGPPAE